MTSHPIDLTRLFAPVDQINKALTDAIAQLCSQEPHSLRTAIEYAVLQGGKRLRPLLAWYACEAVGAPGSASLPGGVAIEFVHAFSLVHDDLPALDNDDLRRGQPTLHKHAGEALAILAGDALLNLAYLQIAAPSPHECRTSLLNILSAATSAMISGQVRDTLGDPTLAKEERLRRIHEEKTGALIYASLEVGYASARAWFEVQHRDFDDTHHAFKRLCVYGRAIGLLFQIVDDLIDVEQSPESAGKRTGKDAAAGKLTYPSVLGIQASKAKVRELHQQALEALAPLGPNAQPLRDLAHYLATRTR